MKKALLALETATDVCSVALHDGTRVVAEATVRLKQQHARALAPLVADVLRWLPGGWDLLGAVAVSAGPGSYTGLRIGLSTAKGLCAARDLDLVAVPSLEALARCAHPFVDEGAVLGAVFPSRRGEVYVQWFSATASGMRAMGPALALSDADAAASAPEETAITLVGGGARSVASLLPHARVIGSDAAEPHARAVAEIGYGRWQAGDTETVDVFEPVYLKAFPLPASAQAG